MSSTNKTTNYELTQFLATDVPSWLVDYNGDMSKIDTQMKVNATAAAAAQSKADGADSKADTNAADIDALEGRMDTAEGEIDTLQSEMEAVEAKAEEEKRLAEEQAIADRLANPTTEDLLKDIKTLLEKTINK